MPAFWLSFKIQRNCRFKLYSVACNMYNALAALWYNLCVSLMHKQIKWGGVVPLYGCNDSPMPRYASRYKNAYRDTDYFGGSHKISSKYKKKTLNFIQTKICLKILPLHTWHLANKSLKFFLTKMPDRRLKNILTIKSLLRVAHQHYSERLSVFPIIYFNKH